MTEFLSRPAAFLFDMDGLLLDTERMFMQAFVTLTSEIGIAAERAEAFFATLVGSSSAHTTARLVEFLPEGIDFAAFDQAWRSLHRENARAGLPVKAHAREILTAIRATQIPVAVVTSTHAETAHHHLDQAGLLPFFETVCAGDEVAANKPDPAPYLEAARRLGVAASDCVAFEDSDMGTTAAVRAGCYTFQVPDLRPADQPLPNLGQVIVPDLGEAARRISVLQRAFA